MTKPLILLGGTDINPELYFEEPHPATDKPDNLRDRKEVQAVAEAVDEGRPVVGICRGAQLLCVLNGGTLDQHNPNHLGNSHPIITQDGLTILNVAADHHQTMKPKGNYTVYGLSLTDNVYEVIWWPETKCLAVQPHPEWMKADHLFNVWLNSLMLSLSIDHTF